MIKRVSLYFEPYAWERLNRYLSYLLLSGKPFYELPTMNDLIESMVVYVSKHMPGVSISGTDLIPYIAGSPSLPTNDRMIASVYEKGRIAFNLTSRTEKALKQIREINKRNVAYINDEVIPEETTDPILIRACIYYLIVDSSNDFLPDLYFTFLFDLGTSMLPLDLWLKDEEIDAMNEKEKNNLRKISWDEGIITHLHQGLCSVVFSPEPNNPVDIFVSEIPEGILKGPSYKSHGFSFNYIQALIGFRALIVGKTYDLSLPEILRGFTISERNVREFTDCLMIMKKYSRSLILGGVQKMEAEEKLLSS
ncbi:MAG: hypothetical protein B2I17_03355 [Thermoplasmatales archaeon B_DKE]|nr:MAG: hypothetical protein B2I17_03355 [Thermoplasmatales archaeon B_DKE]